MTTWWIWLFYKIAMFSAENDPFDIFKFIPSSSSVILSQQLSTCMSNNWKQIFIFCLLFVIPAFDFSWIRSRLLNMLGHLCMKSMPFFAWKACPFFQVVIASNSDISSCFIQITIWSCLVWKVEQKWPIFGYIIYRTCCLNILRTRGRVRGVLPIYYWYTCDILWYYRQ